MIKNSLTYSLIAFVVSVFQKTWYVFKNSVTYRVLSKIFHAFSDTYSKSLFRKIFVSNGLTYAVKTSIIYKIIYFPVKLLQIVSSFFFANLDKSKPNSVSDKVLNRLSDSSVFIKLVLCIWNFILSFSGMFSLLALGIFIIPHDNWNNLYALLIAVIMTVFVFMKSSCNKSSLKIIDTDRIPAALICFFGCIAFSTIVSAERSDSIRVLAFYVTAAIMCLTVSAMLKTDKDFKRFLGIMYAVTILMGAIGIVQGIIGVEASESLTDLSLNKDMPGRIFSTLGNPNNFAEVLVLFLPFSFVFALDCKNVFVRLLHVFALAIPVLALLMTYSRSGWIAFAFAIIMFIVLYNPRLIFVGIVLVFLLLPLLPQSILNRIMTIGNMSDSSSSYRIKIWTSSAKLLRDWFVSGIGLGPGAFSKVFISYSHKDLSTVAHSHMLFMETMIETGITGFVSYIWLMISLIRRACISARKSLSKFQKNIACAGCASLCGLTLTGLFEYSWFYPRVMFAFFICAGVVLASFTRCKHDNK